MDPFVLCWNIGSVCLILKPTKADWPVCLALRQTKPYGPVCFVFRQTKAYGPVCFVFIQTKAYGPVCLVVKQTKACGPVCLVLRHWTNMSCWEIIKWTKTKVSLRTSLHFGRLGKPRIIKNQGFAKDILDFCKSKGTKPRKTQWTIISGGHPKQLVFFSSYQKLRVKVKNSDAGTEGRGGNVDYLWWGPHGAHPEIH